MAQLQRRGRIDVDEDLFDRRLVAVIGGADLADLLQQMQQPLGEGRLVVGRDDAVRDPAQAAALAFDDAPAGAAQAGIEPQDPSRFVRQPFLLPQRGLANNDRALGGQPRSSAVVGSVVGSVVSGHD